MEKIKYIFGIVFLMFVLYYNSDSAYAQDPVQLTMYKGNYKTLKVDTSKTVNWKVYSDKYLNYKVSDNSNSLVIIGKKVGKTKISAKYGKNKIVWNITIREDSSNHIELKKFEKKDKSVVLNVQAIINAKNSDVDFEYGSLYALYVYNGKQFKKVYLSDNFSFDSDCNVMTVKKNKTKKKNIKYALKEKYFEKFTFDRGLYKVVFDTNLKTSKEYIVFEIR